MIAKKRGDTKGPKLEELLRTYFLRAGFFVVRGAPFQLDGEDLTDIDLWLYDRPTGTARRRQIVDAKAKSKPKAVERLLWAKGLAMALDMDGAYVATTDARPTIRRIAKKLGISILDGRDLKRIADSDKVRMPARLTDEELNAIIQSVDRSRKNKEFQTQFREVKSSIIEGFGVNGAVRAIDSVSNFAHIAVSAYPNSEPARLAGRMTYFSAALVAVNLDFVSAEAPFRSADERRILIANAVRYGNTDKFEGLERLRLAIALIRQYGENGAALATVVEKGFTRELEGIPAEIIADHVISMGKSDALFAVARDLESASYAQCCPTFDQLQTPSKSFVGALLDFGSLDRSKFATAWKPDRGESRKADLTKTNAKDSEVAATANSSAGPLFENS